ncbi:MAG: lysophospholipid acyltransferase family protein [Candidatus Rokuibacteriota bacterium]
MPAPLVPAREPRAPTPAPAWYAHGLNHAASYRAVAVLAAALPRAARLALAGVVADLVARRMPTERAAVDAAMARFVPGAAAAERAALVAATFRSFARCFADLVVSIRRPRGLGRLLAGVSGLERLTAAGADGRGVVVLTAHVGNWELAGRTLAAQLDRPTHVVVAAEADAGVERFLRGTPAPVRFVVRRAATAALPLVGALRRGEVVAMQGDRALGSRGDVAQPFFGAPAPFPLGPFVLARAAGVPVVPAFCVMTADDRYAIEVGEPLEVAAGAEPVAQRRWVATLERVVAAHPTQWFNFFDVWSAAPAP